VIANVETRHAMTFEHRPVLLDEVVGLVTASRPRLILDGTLGGAGHSRAMLEAVPDAKLIGIDRDPSALAAAERNLEHLKGRVTLVHAPFSSAPDVLRDLKIDGVDATLVDLGVSSHQLDTGDRGFSFRADAPLDMRMDPTRGETAAELLERLGEEDLANTLYELADERQSRRIARAIKSAKPSTTGALAEIVKRALPPVRDGIHPATRTFQALRMAVNDELGEVTRHLQALPEMLTNDGIAMVITFHSVEDRVVKHFFRDHGAKRRAVSKYAKAESRQAVDPDAVFSPLENATATEEEIKNNPRARSARLRAVKRLPRLQ
jgi:16S rRNA (cytosine1402-N4)-methyltransferase